MTSKLKIDLNIHLSLIQQFYSDLQHNVSTESNKPPEQDNVFDFPLISAADMQLQQDARTRYFSPLNQARN